MATALENAFPLNANWPAAVVRSKLAEAMIAVFDTPDLSGEDFSIQPYPAIAIYGADGDLTLYAFDAGDTTTADDGGVTCIVVSGRRYKRSGELIVRDAAISAVVSAQPPGPSFGDTYIIPAAPTGNDWASRAKTVATFTARGWIFRQPFVGMMVYVEDEDAIYHYASDGNWRAGLPIGAIPNSSIAPTKLQVPFAILKVEDVRNAPPAGAPTAGTMYQVGTAPTGIFAGHVSHIARWSGAAYEFIVPSEGDTIYRKDQGNLFTYRAGAWVVTIPRTAVSKIYYASNSGGTSFTGFVSLVSKAITATPEMGTHIKIDLVVFKGSLSFGGGTQATTVELGVRKDTESSFTGEVDSTVFSGSASSSASGLTLIADLSTNQYAQGLTVRSFLVPIPDANEHTYSISIRRASGNKAVSLNNYTIGCTYSVISIEP